MANQSKQADNRCCRPLLSADSVVVGTIGLGDHWTVDHRQFLKPDWKAWQRFELKATQLQVAVSS